jgi:hypothetical protein
MNGPMMAWFSGLNRKADEARFKHLGQRPHMGVLRETPDRRLNTSCVAIDWLFDPALEGIDDQTGYEPA